MIPSNWFRRLILALFVLEMAGSLMWLASRMVSDPADQAFAETVAGIVFLLGFYSGAPLSARFLAPVPSKDDEKQRRLANVIASMPRARPVFLYDHDEQNAITVGIIASHSRIYVTSSLMDNLSDEGLRGILAHEDTHVEEHHILVTFTYASAYALVAHIADGHNIFVFGFFAFMTMRRHLEYRADAGAALLVGKAAIVAGLKELNAIYPTKRSSRWFAFAMPYPTLPMRIQAVETGKQWLF